MKWRPKALAAAQHLFARPPALTTNLLGSIQFVIATMMAFLTRLALGPTQASLPI
jgi:hypothetical protein